MADAWSRMILLAAAIATTGASLGAAGRASLPEQSAARKLDLESFDQVWTTVRDSYWDAGLGGLDWEAAREELRPRVERATSTEEARAVIEELLDRLGQSHFAIIPAALYDDLGGPDGSKEPDGGVPGFDLRVVDGQAVVTSVQEGSPAAGLGVRPGWVVKAVRGEELGRLIGRVMERHEGRPGAELLLVAGLKSRLDGPIGRTLPLLFLDGSDREVALDLPLVAEKGTVVHLGYLPPMAVWIESRRPAPGVGLIAFNAFLDPGTLMPHFAEAVESFLEARGIVLDLRGNPGGIGGMAMGMAGWFVARTGQRLGTMTTRDASIAFIVYPRPTTYAGPLAVLVDGLSASTAEILASGLKDLGRARLFGVRTAAMALPSRIDRLPNGDGFQYAIASYLSAGGTFLEGNGVVPDVEVRLDRRALLAGRDPALEAALAWIATQAPPAAAR